MHALTFLSTWLAVTSFIQFIYILHLWAASWQNRHCGCAPSEDSDQPGHPPSLIRVFAVRMKKAWVLSYPLSTSEDSDQTGRMPRLIWVFAGRTVILLVLSRGGFFLHNKKITFLIRLGKQHSFSLECPSCVKKKRKYSSTHIAPYLFSVWLWLFDATSDEKLVPSKQKKTKQTNKQKTQKTID